MTSNNLTCALSGQSPIQDPVVTPTGQICSKKLLLQKLTETNYINPFTTATPMPLDESQLIEIETGGVEENTVPPKPSNSNSIPSILNTLSSEYDAIVLELFDTRKALEETRKELSVALYQNDAAIRVIARVVLERDLARRQLAESEARGGSSKRKRDDAAAVEDVGGEPSAAKKVNVVEEDSDIKMKEGGSEEGGNPNPIPEVHSAQLHKKWSQLFKSRKSKTKAGPNHASLEEISKFDATVKKYHKANNKGIMGLVAPILSADEEPVIVSVGKSDKQLIWYNSIKHQIQKSDALKKIILNSQCLSIYNNVTALVTSDYILHVHSGSKASASLVLDNQDEIVGICVHPTCEHIFISMESGNIQIIHLKESNEDTVSLESIAILEGLKDDTDVKCTCMGLHPDGLILALGRDDGKISVWDLKTQKLASTLEGSSQSNSSAAIKTMTFSEKGYHVAVSTEDGFITVWDLRKQKNVGTIASDDNNSEAFATALSFDPIGKYLAYGTSHGKVIVSAVKELNKKIVLDNEMKKKNGGGMVTGLAWGVDAQSIVTCREDDRAIKFWSSIA